MSDAHELPRSERAEKRTGKTVSDAHELPRSERAGKRKGESVHELDLTRRALLGSSLALTLTACESLGREPAQADPDVAAVRRVVASEEDLLAYYEATLRRHPRMATQLDPIMSDHRAHVRTLRAQVSRPPAAVASPSASMRSRNPPPSPSPPVPASRAEATAALTERERSAAAARVEDVLATPPFLAQLLASIGASEAGHAALLGGFE